MSEMPVSAKQPMDGIDMRRKESEVPRRTIVHFTKNSCDNLNDAKKKEWSPADDVDFTHKDVIPTPFRELI